MKKSLGAEEQIANNLRAWSRRCIVDDALHLCLLWMTRGNARSVLNAAPRFSSFPKPTLQSDRAEVPG